ncbi:MAG TPA: peroxiredoxin [Gemmataceae bacterium]|nr:peroxiredoxin [Gemmataceae bacterium]
MIAWKRLVLTSFVLAAWVAAAGGTPAAEDKTELKKGDKVPSFQATDDKGKTWKSGEHVGKKVIVVYFFPADFTGGCTKQACSYRDDMGKLTSAGIEVVGVSGDSAKTHALFKKHHKLNYTLLADEKGEIAKLFGVPFIKKSRTAKGFDENDKEIMVERGITIQRWTFVIGKDGTIVYKNPAVKADQDSKRILEVVKKQGK